MIRLLFRKSFAVYKLMIYKYYWFIASFKFWINDVKYKNLRQANGPILINAHKNSQIIIGCNFRFNSLGSSNPVGLNRVCQISTMNENAKIIIGENVGISGTVISAFEGVQIGNNVLCGGNVTIMDSDWHSINPLFRNDKRYIDSSKIIIEDNVWLGYNTIICKGVRIGENSVIGAGSIVTKDIPANKIATGVPCKVIRHNDY